MLMISVKYCCTKDGHAEALYPEVALQNNIGLLILAMTSIII